MTQDKYDPAKVPRAAVLLFLFLNLMLAFSPVIHASSLENTPINFSGFPAQQHSPEQDENNRPNHLLDEQQEYQTSSRNRQNSTSFFRQKPFAIPGGKKEEINNTPFDQPYLLIRPSYYSFLSLFHLF